MKTYILLVSTSLLGACSVGPEYRGPPANPSTALAFARAPSSASPTAPQIARWWEGFGDPTLDKLVDDALANSPTIDQATARIREAQANLRQQRARQLPSASANVTYVHAELPGVGLGSSGGGNAGSDAGGDAGGASSTALNFYNLGLNASWEFDLFGGGRRSIQQRRATAAAREADLADVQVSLSAQVAHAYVRLRDVQERIRLNTASTRLQEQQLGLSRQRLARGTASQLDLERLQGQLEDTQAQAIPLGAQVDEYLNQLAVLVGRAPGALDRTLGTALPVPLPPASVAVGDPAALIVRRPDIRSAERQLAASTAGIGISKAKELPGIRFLGLLGLGGTAPGNVFDLNKLTALAAPSLSWSFLDFGRNRAATAASVAQRDQAEATYRQTVLEALQDAENALSRFGNTRAQLGQLARAEATTARAAALNRQRVAAGTSTLIDQLDVERRQLSAKIAVSQAKAQLSESYIAVNKALGLGWAGAGSEISAGVAPPTVATAPLAPDR